MAHCRIVLLGCLFLLSTGCAIPVSNKLLIPYEIAGTVSEYQQKIENIAPGMSMEEVEAKLSRNPEKPIDLYSAVNVANITVGDAKTCILYSCFARLSQEEILRVRNAIIFEIPFAHLPTEMRPNLLKLGAEFRTAGTDAKAYLIFTQNGILEEVRKPDKLWTDRTDLETIFSAIRGAGQSGAAEAGKRAISIP